MWCPTCGDEFRAGFDRCGTCDVALVPAGHLRPQPERVPVGRFHRSLAPAVVADLERRGVVVDAVEGETGAIDVRGVGLDRELLRAQLLTDWEGLLEGLDPEVRAEVLASGREVPGWFDPPDSVWVDRAGRLRAGDARGEESRERALGPALITIGGLLLVTAWYVGAGGLALIAAVAGLVVLLAGVFSPR